MGRTIDMSEMPAGFVGKFWSRVDIRQTDECWEWKRARTTSGYGATGYGQGNKMLYANRVALAIKLGGRLEGDVIARHNCDNPPCCNPAHLERGDHADNMRDRSMRGRHPKGSRASQSKLTEADIPVIRRALAAGMKAADIGRRFNVSVGAISAIRRGETWRQVS